MRNYEDHISECDYTKGWNDAMDFIFPEAKEKREKERRACGRKVGLCNA